MLPAHHNMKVVPNEQANSPYPFKAKCSCQWEALAFSEEEGELFIKRHTAAHPLKTSEASK